MFIISLTWWLNPSKQNFESFTGKKDGRSPEVILKTNFITYALRAWANMIAKMLKHTEQRQNFIVYCAVVYVDLC